MPEPGEEETVRVVALDHSFHIQCYKCEVRHLIFKNKNEIIFFQRFNLGLWTSAVFRSRGTRLLSARRTCVV